MSGFATILEELVTGLPGATTAVFLDWDGEAVALHSLSLPQLEASIVGAQWGVTWRDLGRSMSTLGLGGAEEAVISLDEASVVILRIEEGYHLMVEIAPGKLHAKSLVAVRRAGDLLRAEM